MKLVNPDFGFWVCCAAVLVNVALVLIAPTQELESNALTSGALCGIGALCFWMLANGAERDE